MITIFGFTSGSLTDFHIPNPLSCSRFNIVLSGRGEVASSTNAQKFYHLPMRWVILKQIQHGVSQLSYHASMESRFCHTKISLLIVFTPRWSNLQYKNLDGHGVYIAPLKFSSLPARRSNFCTVGLVPCDRNTGTHKEWIKKSLYLPWSQNGKRRTLFQIPVSHLHLAHPRK